LFIFQLQRKPDEAKRIWDDGNEREKTHAQMKEEREREREREKRELKYLLLSLPSKRENDRRSLLRQQFPVIFEATIDFRRF